MRVIEYSVADDDGVSEMFCLITTLLDPTAAPALELARCYAERWSVEVLFKLVKVDLRESGGILRSGKPDGVRQEIWALLCVYQARRDLDRQERLDRGPRPGPRQLPRPYWMPSKAPSGRHFPPILLARALQFLIADLPDMLIRNRPPRTAPRKTKRPHLSYQTRSSTDPGTDSSPAPSCSTNWHPKSQKLMTIGPCPGRRPEGEQSSVPVRPKTRADLGVLIIGDAPLGPLRDGRPNPPDRTGARKASLGHGGHVPGSGPGRGGRAGTG